MGFLLPKEKKTNKKPFKEQKSTKIKGTKSACSEHRAATESKCWMGVDTQGNGKRILMFFLCSHYPTGRADAKQCFLLCLSRCHLSHQSPNRVSGKIFLLSVLSPFFPDPVTQLWFFLSPPPSMYSSLEGKNAEKDADISSLTKEWALKS